MTDAKVAIVALVNAAAAGKPDAAWLDKAIRKAGYVPRGDRATRDEVRETIRAILVALEEVALECGEKCGEHLFDRLLQTIERVQRSAPTIRAGSGGASSPS